MTRGTSNTAIHGSYHESRGLWACLLLVSNFESVFPNIETRQMGANLPLRRLEDVKHFPRAIVYWSLATRIQPNTWHFCSAHGGFGRGKPSQSKPGKLKHFPLPILKPKPSVAMTRFFQNHLYFNQSVFAWLRVIWAANQMWQVKATKQLFEWNNKFLKRKLILNTFHGPDTLLEYLCYLINPHIKYIK